MEWFKKMFVEDSPKQSRTTMVEVLRELWDIKDTKHREMPPPNVDTDIYHVTPTDKAIPHRPSRGRRRYKKFV